MVEKDARGLPKASGVVASIFSVSSRRSPNRRASLTKTWMGAFVFAIYASGARSEVSIRDLAAKIEKLEAENRSMRADIANMRAGGVKHSPVAARRPRDIVSTAAVPARSATAPVPTVAAPFVAAPLVSNPTVAAAATHRGAMTLGNVTITPGGFLAAESIFRTRALQADIATPFAAVPTSNQSFAHTNEFRYTPRQSRAAVLAEVPLAPYTTFAAYTEVDFLGAAGTANNIESQSYTPRIRVLYGTLDSTRSGLHFLAGQNWTLATTNSKGIMARDEALPPTIDEQFIPGFVWLRQPQIRLVKDFGEKVWLALSAEASATTFGGSGCTTGSGQTTIAGDAGVAGITCQVFPQGSGGFNNVRTPYSLNHVPDVIGKVAVEPTIAGRDMHLEAYALYRDLFDRVTYANGSSTNHDSTGYGFGGGLVAPIIPRRVELQVSGLIGRGIGRYATSTLSDATFAADGSVKPIPEAVFLAGLTWHATQALDIYAFGGFERQQPTYFATGPNAFAGVGVPNANNSGCNVELSTACSTDTQQTREITIGFWDDIYKGGYGKLRGGVQYGYVTRSIFSSIYNGQFYAPKANDNILYTSLRYYPFQ